MTIVYTIQFLGIITLVLSNAISIYTIRKLERSVEKQAKLLIEQAKEISDKDQIILHQRGTINRISAGFNRG